MPRTALLVGATGLVGSSMLDRLLDDARWSRVIVLTRRSVGKEHAKLDERLVDFEKLSPALDGVNDVFACLGTTIKVAGTQEKFRRVDHDYTVEVAKLARDAGATRLALVSSVGASERSGSFYLRVKGETERDVGALGYERLVIAQPSYLLGARSERRTAEGAGIRIASALAPLMLGGLRAYRPVAARDVAASLIEAIGGETLTNSTPDENPSSERERKRDRAVLTYSMLVRGKHA